MARIFLIEIFEMLEIFLGELMAARLNTIITGTVVYEDRAPEWQENRKM